MKSTRFFLEHIREQARYLTETATGLVKDDFVNNRTLVLAFERSLEIIGEAVGKIDDSFKAAHPAIPWRKIRGLRRASSCCLIDAMMSSRCIRWLALKSF